MNISTLRPIRFSSDFTCYAEGSVLSEFGETRVLCTVSVEEKVPPFLRNTGTGWISAEYAMLPRATQTRKTRDAVRGRIDGRSQEIQRLIGRSLRAAVDLKALGERTLWIDCDVLQADGGTRTAAISGAYVAMVQALYKLYQKKRLPTFPIKGYIGAVSVGIVQEQMVCDLCYAQDTQAAVDMTLVLDQDARLIEIQGSAEKRPFSQAELQAMLKLGEEGIEGIFAAQKEALGEEITALIGPRPPKKIVLATGNNHKIQEIQAILESSEVTFLSLKDAGLEGVEIEESGLTFEENALIKAREICKRTGLAALADDSGLEVDYLDKAPGVYSARYAGEPSNDLANNQKLIQNLQGTSHEQRHARFVTVLALVCPSGQEVTAKGLVEGHIALTAKGSNGFGYDPHFVPLGHTRSFGEMSEDEKNKLSHRSRALAHLRPALQKLLQEGKLSPLSHI